VTTGTVPVNAIGTDVPQEFTRTVGALMFHKSLSN